MGVGGVGGGWGVSGVGCGGVGWGGVGWGGGGGGVVLWGGGLTVSFDMGCRGGGGEPCSLEAPFRSCDVLALEGGALLNSRVHKLF